MKLDEWLYLATSLTIDWSTTTTTTKGRRKTAHDQIPGHSKAVLSLFLQETTMQTTTTFDSIEQVQSIDQLFWKQQQQNKNNEAKKTQLQNINNNNNNINFQTANVKMNVRRVEQNINNNNNRKTKWQMTAKWSKTKVVAPLQRKKQLNIIWLWRQQHLMNSTYRRQNI